MEISFTQQENCIPNKNRLLPKINDSLIHSRPCTGNFLAPTRWFSAGNQEANKQTDSVLFSLLSSQSPSSGGEKRNVESSEAEKSKSLLLEKLLFKSHLSPTSISPPWTKSWIRILNLCKTAEVLWASCWHVIISAQHKFSSNVMLMAI